MTFEACDRQACTEVEIIDDCELEDTEQFKLSLLRNGLDPDISIGDDSITTITIPPSLSLSVTRLLQMMIILFDQRRVDNSVTIWTRLHINSKKC